MSDKSITNLVARFSNLGLKNCQQIFANFHPFIYIKKFSEKVKYIGEVTGGNDFSNGGAMNHSLWLV